ncbi:MAG: hypothetical protein ACK4IX_12970 [Candidatus Sericytochromatia bacterium]
MSGFPISSNSPSINSIEKRAVAPKQVQNQTLPQNNTTQATAPAKQP